MLFRFLRQTIWTMLFDNFVAASVVAAAAVGLAAALLGGIDMRAFVTFMVIVVVPEGLLFSPLAKSRRLRRLVTPISRFPIAFAVLTLGFAVVFASLPEGAFSFQTTAATQNRELRRLRADLATSLGIPTAEISTERLWKGLFDDHKKINKLYFDLMWCPYPTPQPVPDKTGQFHVNTIPEDQRRGQIGEFEFNFANKTKWPGFQESAREYAKHRSALAEFHVCDDPERNLWIMGMWWGLDEVIRSGHEIDPLEQLDLMSLDYLYFSFTSITTTGFGDIVPVTPEARMYVGLEILFGVIAMGMFLNALGSRRSNSEILVEVAVDSDDDSRTG